MAQTRTEFTTLLYSALAEPIGLALCVPQGTPEQARQRLYAARAKAGDARLDSLQIRIAPPALKEQGIDLVIVKGQKSANEELLEELGI